MILSRPSFGIVFSTFFVFFLLSLNIKGEKKLKDDIDPKGHEVVLTWTNIDKMITMISISLQASIASVSDKIK